MSILEFLNKHYCLEEDNLSDLLLIMKDDFKEEFTDELENVIYAYHLYQLSERRRNNV